MDDVKAKNMDKDILNENNVDKFQLIRFHFIPYLLKYDAQPILKFLYASELAYTWPVDRVHWMQIIDNTICGTISYSQQINPNDLCICATKRFSQMAIILKMTRPP